MPCGSLAPSHKPCLFGDCVNGTCVCWPGMSQGTEMYYFYGTDVEACTTNLDNIKALYGVLFGTGMLNLLFFCIILWIQIQESAANPRKRKGGYRKLVIIIRVLPSVLAIANLSATGFTRYFWIEDKDYVLGRGILVSIFVGLSGVFTYISSGNVLKKYLSYMDKEATGSFRVFAGMRKPHMKLRKRIQMFTVFSAFTHMIPIVLSTQHKNEVFWLRLFMSLETCVSFALTISVALLYRPVLNAMQDLLRQNRPIEEGGDRIDISSDVFRRTEKALKANIRLRNYLVVGNGLMGVFDFIGCSTPLGYSLYHFVIPARMTLGNILMLINGSQFLFRRWRRKNGRSVSVVRTTTFASKIHSQSVAAISSTVK